MVNELTEFRVWVAKERARRQLRYAIGLGTVVFVLVLTAFGFGVLL